MKIGFFDSGLGGISVLHEAVKHFPNESFLYYADTLHVPYGSKTKEEVKSYVLQAAEEIIKQDVKALVVACNTATSIAIETLRATYNIPIIGMEPAAKPALEISRSLNKRVLVFATSLTLKQAKYKHLLETIDDQSLIDSIPLQELVQYCENLNFDQDTLKAYFQSKVQGLDLQQYGTVVLGCTHFPFYRGLLRDMFPPSVQFIDGSIGTVKRLEYVLKERNMLNTAGDQSVTFTSSSGAKEYEQKMKKAFHFLEKGKHEKVQKTDLV
ncbi:glutamate racemase [Priestia filamentosa]|uniref:glutamate racemase n=1 Tax=Priestia filamentosa TaxID=1402861 RepID=UPI001FB1BC0C|nr:glutamate racemase [Priestia filamentosa]MED3729009.1 glutamate racemase [Priestia filamentosa]UOE58786.1 glutamate racemase [Priestia filamentosa]